jgi:NADPH2:quinone reductase
MRAIVVTEHGGPEVLEVRDEPAPEAGRGQVVVGVGTAGVNYRDVYERVGGGYAPGTPPFVAGVEGAGTVQAVGEGVATLAAGDRVAWVAGQGSYAEQVAVDADAVVPVPEGVSTEDAAAVLLQGVTAQYLATSTYPVAEGDTVVVHAAAGGVGLLLTQIVKLRGARVIATTSTPEKAALARDAGADEVIGYDELRDDVGAAVVYDGVGKATFDRSLAALRPRGTLVLYGAASGQPDPVAPATLAAKSLFLTRPGLGAYTADRTELLARADDVFGWMAAGKLSVRIGERYALEDARRAHEDLEARRTTGKLVLSVADRVE